MESSSMGVLLSKLKDPHPMVQRYAVRSIFKTMKVQIGKNSTQDYEQTLTQCMAQASHSSAALEETLLQLCSLVLEDDAEATLSRLILAHLQAALECAPPQAVPSVVQAIGCVCKNLMSTRSQTLDRFQAHELHPFVKAFRSCRQSHFEILQQVFALLTQENSFEDLEVMRFLQPFFHYILLHSPKHGANLLAARDLYFGLASLTFLNFRAGIKLVRLLMHYVSHLMSQTPEEADWKLVAVRELVDAFENLVMQALSEAEVEQCITIAADIQTYLVNCCYEAIKLGLSCQTFLKPLGCIVNLQKGLETTMVWRIKILKLGHLLTMTSVTEEQVTLTGLARNVLRKKDIEGTEVLIDSSYTFPFLLLWVYPAVNAMTSSCTILKETAGGLLQDVEDLLANYWPQRFINPNFQAPDMCMNSSYLQLADNMETIIFNLWFRNSSWRTWISTESLDGWFFRNYDSQSWLTTVTNNKKGNVESFAEMTDPWRNSTSWICLLLSILLIHPESNSAVVKAVTEVVKMDSAVGLSFIPVVLFYLRSWEKHSKRAANEHMFRLLKLLPSLGSHPMSASIVSGIVQAMLHSDRKLSGTGIRLLCKTWENADKVYPQLKVHLDLCHFLGPVTGDDETLLGRAASLMDVCEQDADHGVDLILSVQACIESGSSLVKAFGLHSLGQLCKHDVIDFYTAWDVISSWFVDVPANATLAESFCLCLQNGALDAEAYPESSSNILHLLWKAVNLPERKQHGCHWWTVKEKALIALASFEVDNLTQSLQNFAANNVNILLSETRKGVLQACERLVVKFLHHEFKNRRRGKANVRYNENKLGKMIVAIPQVFSATVQKESTLWNSPAAYLIRNYHKAPPYLPKSQPMDSCRLQGSENEFEQLFVEMADTLDSGGNLVSCLVHLDVWYSFLTEQLKEKDGSNVSMSNAAKQMVKILRRLTEEAIPRIAENAIFALAVLNQIAASQAVNISDLPEHFVSYLKSCLTQSNHEYLQWTSAAALGYMAQNFGKADWGFKMEITTSLLECLYASDRDIVRGACGMGLSFLFLKTFTNDDVIDTEIVEGVVQRKESTTYFCIFQQLVKLLLVWCPEMAGLLHDVSKHNTKHVDSCTELPSSLANIRTFNKTEGEMWTVVGLILALGSSAVALERVGYLDVLSDVTKFLMRGISMSQTTPESKDCFIAFSLGAYIAFPSCIRSCLRLGLLHEELDKLIPSAEAFLTPGTSRKNVTADSTMAVCIGSGNLLALLLDHRTYQVPKSLIFSLLDSLKVIALDHDAKLASVGGFVGLANALGAGVALLVPHGEYGIEELKSLPPIDGEMESLSICTPLLYESSCRMYVSNLLQDILQSGLHGSNPQRSMAWWCLALVFRTFTKVGLDPSATGVINAKSSKLSLSSLAKDGTLSLLCSWLLHMKWNQVESFFPWHTVTSVLRCLKQALQLPSLDWGTLLRQILYQVSSPKELVVAEASENTVVQDDLCRECILFALVHARSFSNLQSFLDELCDFPRLISIKPSMSGVLMLHMDKLSVIFSKSRMERFFFDCVEVTCRTNDSRTRESSFSVDCCWDLRISFWKGFKSLLSASKDGSVPSIDTSKLLLGAEKCLSLLETPLNEAENQSRSVEEWSVALECVALTSDEWIAKITELDSESFLTAKRVAAQKAIFVKSQMVARRRLQPAALMKTAKLFLHNQAVPGAFEQLVWIASALKDITIDEKLSWLMDTIETVFSLENPEMGVVFLGLLVSRWCYYSPLILIDKRITTKLLPFTLQSLLSEPAWRPASKQVLQRCVVLLSNVSNPTLTARGLPLWYVKRACANLRKDLPFEAHLKLVDDFSTGAS